MPWARRNAPPSWCGDLVSLTGDGGRGAGGYRRHRPEPLAAGVHLPLTARRQAAARPLVGPPQYSLF